MLAQALADCKTTAWALALTKTSNSLNAKFCRNVKAVIGIALTIMGDSRRFAMASVATIAKLHFAEIIFFKLNRSANHAKTAMKLVGLRSLIPVVITTIGSASPVMADLGSANSFVVLSSDGSVSFEHRDNVDKVPIPGAVTCPGAAGCPMEVGGRTISMEERGQINGDVIAAATASQGIQCA